MPRRPRKENWRVSHLRRSRGRSDDSLHRLADRVGRSVARIGALWREAPVHASHDSSLGPEEVGRFLRDCGAVLCRAGETTRRVEQVIVELGARYAMPPVHAFVLPTGVFVRIGDGPGAVTDFTPVHPDDLRLDQIGELYAFLDELLHDRLVPPEEGMRRLAELEARPPRFTAVPRIAGYAILTVGLGLLTYPNPMALVGYAVLGVAVGLLRELVVGPLRLLALALPVVAAVVVTVLAYRFSGPLLGENPSKMVIPPLLAFLPGAALTMGTMELATGSLVSGSSRLVYGVNVLVLLAFGITIGAQLMTAHPVPDGSHAPSFGAWAPWAGAVLLGVGFALNSSASLTRLPWLLVVLVSVEGVQQFGRSLAGTLVGAFLGGVVLPLVARIVEQWRAAPPAQVTFLPAFWMLVPGSLSLTGVGELVAGHASDGLLTTVNALLTVVAVALGVMVGASTLHNGGTVVEPAEATRQD
ncbi:threonine/serine exporter ThrE family protein [Streptomyces sp. VRA16 Mangrove soil]|uniref:threonine/serine ThrE exporter family protein n=1 Tax=Streptomyces sp. VRA16 Mangrove soil TaxID=2817434 RepID=UPI001A9FC5A2|nr:threonine/serine exporter family protein [Streptomyces sp. VRA16 Mangrove soil]MBO1330239.1 threonine/serine exporter family protein [Streptomyces sp. VRA16 Mangrove soil]